MVLKKLFGFLKNNIVVSLKLLVVDFIYAIIYFIALALGALVLIKNFWFLLFFILLFALFIRGWIARKIWGWK